MAHGVFASALETGQLVGNITPADLSVGANPGDWVSMKGFQRVLCVLFKGIGTAGQDPIFKLQQATVVAGSDAKPLNFTDFYTKIGTQNAIGQFTHQTQVAANTCTPTSAASEAIIAVDVRWDMLDIDGGFCCVNLSIAKVGASAQVGSSFYYLYGARDGKDIVMSAIVD